MRNNKAAAFLGLLAASMEDKSLMKFTEPLTMRDFPAMFFDAYIGKKPSKKKSPLNKQQMKRRAAAKAARKARRRGR